MQTNTNRIFLRGRMAARPALSHANHGVDYFTFPLAVRRLSGAEDRLNIVASREQLERLLNQIITNLENEVNSI